MSEPSRLAASHPVRVIDTGSASDDPAKPQEGLALCLSGGGYRAMLFHLGSLQKLNEFGYLKKLARVSSVSGGTITAGVLGFKWRKLSFDANNVATNFDAEVVQPIRNLAGKTVDAVSVIGGIFMPGSIADKVADAYRKYLFGDATLQDLPSDPPRFVINATNVQSGALFRFSKPFMADYRIGMVRNPTIDLAIAVAASSAFPPVLSPLRLELDATLWAPPSDRPSEDLHREPFLTDVVLTDGGVYDNLGLETAWKKYSTVLVSNGGGKMQAEPDPKGDPVRHALRVNEIIDNQVRNLRSRQVIKSFQSKAGEEVHRKGAYWGIRVNLKDYTAPSALSCPFEQTQVLAQEKTRLKRLEAMTQERLINWGYAVTDAAMRSWVDSGLPPPKDFPYPASKVG